MTATSDSTARSDSLTTVDRGPVPARQAIQASAPDALGTDADRVRELSAREPSLRNCEIARHLGLTPQRVHDALKYTPCAECRRLTKQRGLCPDCARARLNIGECKYYADGVRVPLRDAEGAIAAWAIVSVDDAPAVSRHLWSLTPGGYAHRRERKHEHPERRVVLLHRAILGLDHGDSRQADHVSGNRLDNRRENLRVVSAAENAQNRVCHEPGSSRFRGVSFYKRDCVWVASVTHNGRTHYAGRWATEEEAAVAAAAKRADLFTHANEARQGHWFPPADSDHETHDRWRDELATDDPYTQDWVPARTHGPVHPPDGAALFAALPSSRNTVPPVVAGRSESADAPELPSPARARADHPVDP